MIVEALSGLLTRATIENPNVPLSSDRIVEYLSGGLASSSGETVSQQTVLGHPSIFRGISLIANDVAKIPVFVYRKDGDNREQDLNHPASPLLRKRANGYIRSHVFLKTMVGHACLHRGGYGRIFRNNAGAPVAMDILDPELTYPVVENGRLRYQTRINGNDVLIDGQDVFHVRGLGWDGLDGWSVIDKLKEAIGSGLAAQRFTSVYFKNNAQPRVIIRFPGYLDSETAVERFRASWGAVHSGAENAHKPAVLEGGAEVTPFQMSNDDAQLIQLRELDNRIIATILGLPSHMLNDDTKTSFASLEQENQRYLDQTIDPWLREIETEASDKLLTDVEHMEDRAFVEFVRSAFVRADLETRFAAYNTGITAGFMSREEVRKLENMNSKDPELAKFLQPLNMVEAGEEPAEVEPEAPPQSEAASETNWKEITRNLTKHRTELLVQRVARSAEKAARSPSKFLEWIDGDLRDAHYKFFVKDFSAAYPAEVAEELAEKCFRVMSEGLLEASGQVTASQLPETVSQVVQSYMADLPPQIAADFISKVGE